MDPLKFAFILLSSSILQRADDNRGRFFFSSRVMVVTWAAVVSVQLWVIKTGVYNRYEHFGRDPLVGITIICISFTPSTLLIRHFSVWNRLFSFRESTFSRMKLTLTPPHISSKVNFGCLSLKYHQLSSGRK